MITCISRTGNLTHESQTSSDFICTVHWQWCIKTLNRWLLIIYYQQKMTVNCLFSGFLRAWISAVSASSRNLPRETSKSNKQLISSSEVTSRKLETKSKTIIYRADLSGRYFFVCQLFFLHELIKQRSSDVTGRHYRLNDSDVSLVEFATRGDGWNSF